MESCFYATQKAEIMGVNSVEKNKKCVQEENGNESNNLYHVSEGGSECNLALSKSREG